MLEWALLDEQGQLIQRVSCQYDACDLSQELYDAIELELDFIHKEARITKTKGSD